VGAVALSGVPERITDAWLDPRFNNTYDMASGYRTKSLCMGPVHDHVGRTVAVVQAINKKTADGATGMRHFTADDEVTHTHTHTNTHTQTCTRARTHSR
jgi:hypothetical protein